MKKFFFLCLLGISFLNAEEALHVDDFEASVFSKVSQKPVQIEVYLIFEGRDIQEGSYKILDTLNIIIGSFYAENLLTSQGKEGLKKAIINYSKDKYAIDIDHIYIQKLNIKKVSTSSLIEDMKKNGCCNK